MKRITVINSKVYPAWTAEHQCGHADAYDCCCEPVTYPARQVVTIAAPGYANGRTVPADIAWDVAELLPLPADEVVA